LKKYKEYARCVAGALIVAAGTYFFKFPNNFSIGGVTGVAVILSNYFRLASAGTIVFIINILLLGAGLFVCGRDTFVKTTIGTLTLSSSLILLEKIWPLKRAFDEPAAFGIIFCGSSAAFRLAVLFDVTAAPAARRDRHYPEKIYEGDHRHGAASQRRRIITPARLYSAPRRFVLRCSGCF
jgi:uncharacterized membrane-anchored protein YitT (DUF2179 family)